MVFLASRTSCARRERHGIRAYRGAGGRSCNLLLLLAPCRIANHTTPRRTVVRRLDGSGSPAPTEAPTPTTAPTTAPTTGPVTRTAAFAARTVHVLPLNEGKATTSTLVIAVVVVVVVIVVAELIRYIWRVPRAMGSAMGTATLKAAAPLTLLRGRVSSHYLLPCRAE